MDRRSKSKHYLMNMRLPSRLIPSAHAYWYKQSSNARGIQGCCKTADSRTRPIQPLLAPSRRLALRSQGHADCRWLACLRAFPEPALRDATVDALAQTLQDSSAPQEVAARRCPSGCALLSIAAGRRKALRSSPRSMAALSSPDQAALHARTHRCAPTGRNLYGIDPRAVPTRTAWEIGRRAAEEVLNRHVQDHGEWPKRIVMDLWASATMRTGGDDLAQALALMGVKLIWTMRPRV